MVKLPVVRIAQPEDEEEIMAMCRRLHAENGLFSLSEEKVRDLIHRCYRREGVIVGVIGKPGELQASTCLDLSDYYYSYDSHLGELWNYVLPEYRHGTKNADALIEFCKSCARHLRMPLITGVITNQHMAGKVRLYRRLLGHPVGALFIYNSSWKTEPMEDHNDLRIRLRAQAHKCATSSKLSKKEIEKLASLLKEAADVLSSESNIWGGKSSPKETEALNSHGQKGSINN